MKQIEENVINSFRLAKSDIIKLQKEVIELNQTQKKLIAGLDSLQAKENKLNLKVSNLKTKPVKQKTIVRTIGKAAKKKFVASKEGKKFHIDMCPFAQNIKPKSKIIFKSKSKALNQGYKPCHCIK